MRQHTFVTCAACRQQVIVVSTGDSLVMLCTLIKIHWSADLTLRLTDSMPFIISSGIQAASVRIKQGPERIVYAGKPFHQQPICEVLDTKGNPIDVHNYNVVLTVTDSYGHGCLCDLSNGKECLTALAFPTVQQCPLGTPRIYVLI